SDICQNVDTITQTIQIRDFDSPVFIISPKDTIVHCSGVSPLAIFNNWRDNFGFGQVQDVCNTAFFKALPPGNYSDTLQIVNADIAMYSDPGCPQNQNSTIIGNQIVAFTTYDTCGNIRIEEASFTIIDTLSPSITQCPSNKVVELKVNQCDTTLSLDLPISTDNCMIPLPQDWIVTINDELTVQPDSNSFELYLESGINLIRYTVQDCANNTSSCTSTVEIKDVVPPVLICPSDITIELNNNQCAFNYNYPQLVNYLEVCSAPIDFSLQQPLDQGYIEFQLDNQDGKYKAKDRLISFRDLDLIGELYNPVLTLQYKIDVKTLASVNLLSELGDILFTIDSSNCEETEISIPLNEAQFGFWLNDNRVNFTIDYRGENGDAPTACRPENLSGSVAKDNDSYFRLILNYADIDPRIEAIEINTGEAIDIVDNQSSLSVGTYQIQYSEDDAFGNEGTCTSFLTVEDNIAPEIVCQDIIVNAGIEDSPVYQIEPSSLIQNISDNCSIDSIILSQSTYQCTDIGRSLNIEVMAIDDNGNSNICSSIVTIAGSRLEPQFVSNLCFADTLQLFANVIPDIVDSLIWRGPDGFRSTAFNPIILDIDTDNSGVYFLEVTTVDGCEFIGSLNITINEFSNPQITSDSTAYCVGTEILLNASVFTEEVNYKWYEGIAPNGILIAETDGPSLLVQPPVGKHFYYVEVSSEDCTSNASNSITIDVLSIPVAEIDNPFISICEGETLALSTSIFNSTYNYLWTGPNGYFSRNRIPEVIEEVDLSDQGDYFLVIDNGVCISDTAVAQVVVFSQPITPIIDGQEIICEGESALLTVTNITGANRYHWYKDGTLFRSVSSNTLVIPGVSSLQEGLYTVEVEDGICISERSEAFILNIEDKLNIGATNDGPVCEGDEVNLISSFIPDASYTWIDPSGVEFTGREITVPARQGSYTVIVTSNNNCSATSTTQVEVLPKPLITALSNSSESCMTSDMEIELVATVFPPGQYEYNWRGPGNFQSEEIRPIVQLNSDSINGNYTLVVSQNGCSSEPVSTLVDINIQPDIAIINGSSIVCEGDSIILMVNNPTSGFDVEWIWSSPTGLKTTTDPFLIIENVTNNNQGQYSVIQSVAGCRSSLSAPFNVEIIGRLIQPALFGTSELCEEATISLQTNAVPGASYLWTGPADTIETSEPFLFLDDAQMSQSGNYNVQTIIGDCSSDLSIDFNVQLIALPESPQFELEEIEVCLSNPQDIIVCLEDQSASGVELYELFDLSTNIRLAQSSQNCFDLSILNTGAATEFIIGARSKNMLCYSPISDTLVVRIADIPNAGANIVQSNQLVCDASFLELNAEVPQDISIRWESSDAEVNIFNADQPTVQLTELTEGRSVIYLFSSLGQCIDFKIDSIELEVLQQIQANDDFVTEEYRPTIELDPLTNDIFNQSVFIETIQLDGPGNISLNNNLIQYQAQSPINNSVEIFYTICYEACPDVCSEARIILEVTSESECFAGNLITPNGDGYNDNFVIPCLDGNQYPDNELFIFNEWGDEVFSAAPYSNDWQGTRDGKLLPVGTYFYVLNLGEGQAPVQGFIVLEL
ncbi:MAG: T9SS type B sorting domain-containing protein, partial [Saprospiraceae bacterium]|nr:T9SS type B sorting domain-containing protein [Saprospiraceae bacterium]